MQPIRLAIVGADRLMRDFMRQCVPAVERQFVCVGEAACDAGAVAWCRGAEPDLVLFDFSGRCAAELVTLRQLAEPAARWALLVIAAGPVEHVWGEVAAQHGRGFFSRNSSLEALGRAAYLVATGGTYVDAPLQTVLAQRSLQGTDSHLSQRERHVLQLIAEGYSTKEVATILRLSVKTVDKYRTSLMQKLDVHDVVKLTHCAIRMGFVTVA